MTRVGIIGCAGIARRSLIPAFANHVAFDVVAMASRCPGKAAPVAAEYGCRVCSYEELIESADVDLVYCPLPTGLHHEWVKRALTAGKHVLCEKSLGCGFEEVRDLVETARRRRRFLMESFQFRFHAQNLYVRDLLQANVIGPLRQVVVRFGVPPFPDGPSNIRYSAALGGGALLDNGAYTVKCATYLLGPDVRVLAALRDCGSPALGGVDLSGSIMMDADGIPVHAAYGFDHFYQNSYEIWGKGGKISTLRAFTAREDFAAPVIVETSAGKDVKSFRDDHFARLLDYVATTIALGRFEEEYGECMVQARILADVARKGDR